MLDQLLWRLFPPGGDVLSGVTEALLWVLALLSLGSAFLCGAVRFAARHQPRPVPVRRATLRPPPPPPPH